ncbi:SipW-dependent-type signal peptide-containing protein [Nesterenkonia xinjiangensis]|uniref:Putative ribosomally synthesized peptide with SipW-like signal peptide n=1 Tax=Nesterenkonia xinjiangensis TaxID=225327 RepID=A0A7Z0KAK8_9MICC|nr:SipW-dependent-type signal peptide-containing protein [Nesterenkonia xinjiangensis]NYJ78395.1 putative ribosomally synthesized peptide with SipW-like signal peptide [Nesterenkonia xinjiangensis]
MTDQALTTRRERRRRRSRRRLSRQVRALLASGLVLGVGASVTLAAWNDSEYAGGTVSAGHFTLEGSPDGANYSTTTAEAPHQLSFSTTSNLTPGARTYALFSVRTASGSVGGTVQLQGDDGNTGTLSSAMTYGVRTVAGTTCNASTFEGGSQVIPRGTSLTGDAGSSQSVAGNQGAVVHYCLELTLSSEAPNSVQGATATPLWHAVGTSSSE